MRSQRWFEKDDRGFTLVELLVAMLVTGVVLGGITAVVLSSLRVEQNQRQLQDVVDDGRLALTRIRQEVREARRILPGSDEKRLYFWVDKNQDALVQPEELVCYVVEPIDGSNDRFQVSRWDRAMTIDDCEPGLGELDSGEDPNRTVVAKTLLNEGPFVEFTPEVSEIPEAPATREVEIYLNLEADAPRGPDSMEVQGSIRIRNVP